MQVQESEAYTSRAHVRRRPLVLHALAALLSHIDGITISVWAPVNALLICLYNLWPSNQHRLDMAALQMRVAV